MAAGRQGSDEEAEGAAVEDGQSGTAGALDERALCIVGDNERQIRGEK